jgi:transposase-like protein
MQPLNFAAQPNYIQPFREVQRLFRQDLNVPMGALLRELLEQTMRDTVANQVQAGWHERRPDQRRGYRNGTYRRALLTTVGRIVLEVPRTREFASPAVAVLERCQRRMPEVDAMLRQVFLRGVSTRETGAVLEALCGTQVSATTVSRLTRSLEDAAAAFHTRLLADRYRYLLLDGVYLRVREGVTVKRRVVLCAYGITPAGEREFVDFQLGKSESQSAWEGFLNRLYQRGLTGESLDLVTTDGNTALHRALELVYPRVPRQQCWFHKLQNVTDKLPRRLLSRCRRGLRAVYDATNRAAALRAFRRWRAIWLPVAPAAVRCVERDLEALLAFYDCAAEHWVKIRTSNVIERCFREVRRRVRPMTLFSNPGSCDRIIFAIFSKLNTRWQRHPLPGFTQAA